MRVSERSRYATVNRHVADAKQRSGSALDRLSSQKDLNKLSDDPIKVAKALRMRAEIKSIDQYKRNADFSKNFMEQTETALTGITDNLIRAKELGLAMANDTYDSKSRAATAQEVKQIKNALIQLANTQYNGRFVFGGFRNQTPPLSNKGDYLGDDGEIYLQVGEGAFKRMSIHGRELFTADPEEKQAGHYGMIDTIDLLFEGMMTDDKRSLNSALTELGNQLEKATTAQASVGGMYNSLDSSLKHLDLQNEQLHASLSETQDTDVFQTASEFRQAETVLESTLLASSKLLQPSLLNFLQ